MVQVVERNFEELGIEVDEKPTEQITGTQEVSTLSEKWGLKVKRILIGSEVVQLDENSYMYATNNLFISNRWSYEFAHGPDLSFGYAPLVEKMLGEGEQVTRIQSIEFREMINRELLLFASYGKYPEFIDKEGKKPCLKIVIQTDQGREIYILGFKQEKRISKTYHWGSELAENICRGFGDSFTSEMTKEGEKFTFGLALPSSSNLLRHAEKLDLAEKIQIPMEILSNALAEINFRRNRQDGKVDFIGGYKNLDIPDIGKLLNRGKVTMVRDLNNIRPTGTGFDIIPFRFNFIIDGQVISSGVLYGIKITDFQELDRLAKILKNK